MSQSLLHLSDLHFGGRADLRQAVALERLVPELAPTAVVISGDVSQRARHGEFQRALAFIDGCRQVAPTLVVPGNHDVTWWRSPFGLLGEIPKYRKYRQYFGEELGPVMHVPGAVIVGTVSANGLAGGSVTWNPRDLTVKGHLPKQETDRARDTFAGADPGLLRVVVLHHNVLRGQISDRWGLAHPLDAQRRLVAAGADLVLCGHDHQEAVGQLEGRTIVAASSTHTPMTRGKRPSVFNLIEYGNDHLSVRYHRWFTEEGRFHPVETTEFRRNDGRPSSA